MSGKGSAPRPFAVTQDEYASNWDRIFRKDSGPVAHDNAHVEGANDERLRPIESNDCPMV